MKVRDLIKIIESDGWYHIKTEGDHRQFKNPTKKGRVTIAGHSSVDVPVGTLTNIFRQAQLPKARSK